MLTEKEIEHLAKLAKLELTAQEKEKFARDLSSILNYVQKLNAVDTNKVEPMARVLAVKNVMREDKGNSTAKENSRRLIKEDYVKVKAIFE